MDNMDLWVLEQLLQWQQKQCLCYLVTLVATVGSAPRSPGSILALSDQGDMAGSISGGCVEEYLQSYLTKQTISSPQFLSLTISSEQAQRFLLPCGGKIEVLIEPIQSASLISELVFSLQQQKTILRDLDLATGVVRLVPIDRFHPKLVKNESSVQVVFGPRHRLLVIGANLIGIYLSQMAHFLDYQVLVCDPRTEVRATWPLLNVPVSAEMPDDFIRAQQPDFHTAIVAVTHDLKQDDLALLEALSSSAFFVGAVGSRKTQEARRERLRSLAVSEAHIARLKGPVGLSIGSKTPPEIALAILAQMTAIKNEGNQ